MKMIRIISVLAFLIVIASTSFAKEPSIPAMPTIRAETVSKALAKTLGATILARAAGTNQTDRIGVSLEFAPKGRLQNYYSATLEITSGEKMLVSANLRPITQQSDHVLIYFAVDSAYLATSSLMVYCKRSGTPEFDAFRFNIHDFLTQASLH
jgi:hypothetical protein